MQIYSADDRGQLLEVVSNYVLDVELKQTFKLGRHVAVLINCQNDDNTLIWAPSFGKMPSNDEAWPCNKQN
jgi:hypothetical protein